MVTFPHLRNVWVLVPGTCLSSILVVEPSKTRSLPVKTGVIWIPGIEISSFRTKFFRSFGWTALFQVQASKKMVLARKKGGVLCFSIAPALPEFRRNSFRQF